MATPVSISQDDVFLAVADPNRRHLLETLRDAERTVGSLTDEMTISRPAVSQHLRVLLDAGLATVRSQGRERYYRAGGPGFAILNLWADQFWEH